MTCSTLFTFRTPRSRATPCLAARAAYELPQADPSQRGTVQYVPYTTILGDSGHYLGVYLPAGYDAHRAQPYKVAYLAHGIFGDETDFMVPGNAPNILDNMTARGEIEPTVIVTMGNHFTGTSLGFSSYNQTNAANNLVQTILPFVESNFNASSEPEDRAYAGFSFGGSTGGIVIKNYPTTFGYFGHFSGNPSLTQPDYDNIAAAVGTNGLSVFLGNGVFEGSLNAANAIAANFNSRGIPAETDQVRGAHDMMTGGQLFTIYARDILWDADKDGVKDSSDVCAGTVLPDSPIRELKPNHYAATADGFVNGDGQVVYSLLEAGGCSGSEIVETSGLGEGHLKFGVRRACSSNGSLPCANEALRARRPPGISWARRPTLAWKSWAPTRRAPTEPTCGKDYERREFLTCCAMVPQGGSPRLLRPVTRRGDAKSAIRSLERPA